MPLVVKDRVKESSITSGTGALTLDGAAPGFQTFAAIGNGNTTYYAIIDAISNTWEIGIGTYTLSTASLSRDTVLANSSGNTSFINFTGNPKDVFCTYPAGRSVYSDGTNIVPAISGVLGTANGGTNLSSFSANQLFYASSTSVIGQSANLTFNGTTLTVSDLVDSSLTAGRITYAGVSGNLIDSANLTFNGTTLTVSDLADSSLTAGRVTYAGVSGNLVDSSNLTFNGTTLTAAGLSDSGNLTFTATGSRILGDFSNATLTNRVLFQTTTTDGNTNLEVIPNGTATTGAIRAYSAADPTNSPSISIAQIGTTESRISSEINGTASYDPMTFYTGGSEAMRIDTSRNVGIGISPATKLDVLGVIQAAEAATQDAVRLQGRAGGTSSYAATLTPTTLSASRTLTIPDATTTVVGTDVAQTLTNKRIDPRVSSTASTASLTPDISTFDQYNLTAQAVALTINAPTGTPVDGNKLIFRILDNGVSQTINWNGTYTAIGIVLPTSTVAGKITYVGCIYNTANTRWDVVAVTRQV